MASTVEVSSIYGPGALACWLCTCFSVAISWIFNTSTRKKDNITNDLIAALSLPLIASGQFFYLLSQFNEDPTDSNYETVVASMQAAVWVCKIYHSLGTFFIAIPLIYTKRKRLICTGFITLLCLAVRLAALISRKLQRAMVHQHEQDKFATILAFIDMHHFLLFDFYKAWELRNSVQQLRVGEEQLRLKKAELKEKMKTFKLRKKYLKLLQEIQILEGMSPESEEVKGLREWEEAHEKVELELEEDRKKRPEVRPWWRTHLLSHPNDRAFLIMAGQTLVPTIALICRSKETRAFEEQARRHGWLALIPNTPYSISELDQGGALGAGITTLLFSTWDVYKSGGLDRQGLKKEWMSVRMLCFEGTQGTKEEHVESGGPDNGGADGSEVEIGEAGIGEVDNSEVEGAEAGNSEAS